MPRGRIFSPRRLRADDESVFAPDEDFQGPVGPGGRGFGVPSRSFADDMEIYGGPRTALMPTVRDGDFLMMLEALMRRLRGA